MLALHHFIEKVLHTYLSAERNRSVIFFFSAPCNNPGIPRDGKRIGDNFKHGKSVSFRCPKSHKMRGPKKITCHDGNWSNKKPQCLLPSQVKGKMVFPTLRFLNGKDDDVVWLTQCFKCGHLYQMELLSSTFFFNRAGRHEQMNTLQGIVQPFS